jgi:stage II sporulation protein D
MFRQPMTRLILLLMVLFLLLPGCRRQQPAPKPAPQIEEPVISLYLNETGQKKDMKIEEYLQGVVAAEMDTKWPVNALAAQAILARTYTMENIQEGRVKQLRGTDASTSVEEFQAYEPAKINDNVRQAVEMTRGEVLTHNNNYVQAWFSACCGGISAAAEEGLGYTKGPTPYLKEGAQDGCLSITVPENRAWEARIPLARARTAVQQITGKDPGVITSASIEKKGPSGRAEQIRLGSQTVSGSSLRLALGSEKVRSMLLTDLRVEGGQLVLAGKGFGHGVGLCQWGARLLAEQGKSPEEIVQFYHRNVEIQKRWE